MMQATNSNQQELDGGLQNILSNIIQEQVDSMVSEMTAKVSEELKDLLDQAMEHVKETLGGLAEQVFGGTEENQGAQAMLEPIFETLEQCLKPAARSSSTPSRRPPASWAWTCRALGQQTRAIGRRR